MKKIGTLSVFFALPLAVPFCVFPVMLFASNPRSGTWPGHTKPAPKPKPGQEPEANAQRQKITPGKTPKAIFT